MAKLKTGKITRLVVAIVVCQLAGAVGSAFTAPAIPAWYASLAKPSFTPPSWVFGPVWVTLYTLMGISLFLVWEKGFGKKNIIALYIFGAQLALNALWSILFFGLQKVFYALVEITALWIVIVLTIMVFHRISKKAAWLLVPYLAWVTVATMLNFYIWKLNFGI
jgi:translocator protein